MKQLLDNIVILTVLIIIGAISICSIVTTNNNKTKLMETCLKKNPVEKCKEVIK